MTILCCGDRNWNNALVIRNALLDYIRNDKDLTIIHGNANGTDRTCAFVALELGLNQSNIKSFPANWNKFGKSAGPIRNKQMLDEGKPDLVLAFHNFIANSKGTKNMLEQAKKRNISTKLFTE